MGTTLDHGIYLPDEGERNCYDGLAGNWVALDNHLGSTDIHVTINDKQAWNGHVADTTIHVTSADKQAWNGKADASALTAHTGDTTIHVTAEEKAKWDTVTSKADDSAVVHNTGNETIDGNKSLLKNLKIKNEDVTRGSTTGSSSKSITFTDVGDNTLAIFSVGKVSNGSTAIGFRVDTTDNNDVNINSQFQFFISKSGAKVINPSVDGDIALGRSSNRWSDVQTYKVNALEPSSLSLPSDRSARIDISSYFTNTGTGQSNSYTVPANGYIYLTLSELTNVHCFSRSSGNVTNYAQTFTKLSNSTGALYVLFPVRKNDVFVATWYTTTTVSVDGAFFIPCQGNI